MNLPFDSRTPDGGYGYGYKFFLLMLFAAAYGICYVIPNFWPPFPPVQLPRLPIDYWVPFLPWTFTIYLSDYLLAFFVILLLRDIPSFNSYTRMMFTQLFLCGMFFFFFPTTYPRPVYPDHPSAFIRFLLNLVAVADTPNNCFPSMHVSITGISTWAIRHLDPRLYFAFWIWSIGIFISTLTTKQHYFVDILGGLGIVLTVALFEHFCFRRGTYDRLVSRLRG